jgi:hypothetical protein
MAIHGGSPTFQVDCMAFIPGVSVTQWVLSLEILRLLQKYYRSYLALIELEKN